MDYAPIVMFVYNRADHFTQTYEALAKCPEAKNSILYIFSDGAKNDSAKLQVEQVRQTAKVFAGRHNIAYGVEASVQKSVVEQGRIINFGYDLVKFVLRHIVFLIFQQIYVRTGV